MTKSKVVIKKYGDRRLYDSASRRYVKLEDIARMIRAGTEVQVLDAPTGKDITRAILTQIVVEDARGESGLPTQFLRDLVIASDRATHDVLSRLLNQTLELYKKSGEALHSGLSEARHAVTSPLDFVRHLLSEPAAPNDRNTEMEQLRRRIEELEERLARTGPPRSTMTARKRSASRKRPSR